MDNPFNKSKNPKQEEEEAGGTQADIASYIARSYSVHSFSTDSQNTTTDRIVAGGCL